MRIFMQRPDIPWAPAELISGTVLPRKHGFNHCFFWAERRRQTTAVTKHQDWNVLAHILRKARFRAFEPSLSFPCRELPNSTATVRARQDRMSTPTRTGPGPCIELKAPDCLPLACNACHGMFTPHFLHRQDSCSSDSTALR